MSVPNEILAALRAQEAANETTFLFERSDWPYSPEIDGVVDLADLSQRLLHGPTLTAVKAALREWLDASNDVRNQGQGTRGMALAINRKAKAEYGLRAALRMLEGEG